MQLHLTPDAPGWGARKICARDKGAKGPLQRAVLARGSEAIERRAEFFRGECEVSRNAPAPRAGLEWKGVSTHWLKKRASVRNPWLGNRRALATA